MSVALAGMGGGGSAGGGGDSNSSRLYRSIATGLLLNGPGAAGMAGMEPATSGSSGGSGASGSVAGGDSGTSRPLLGAKYKYDRLNLTINELGEHDGGPIVHSHRHISMFWQEKVSLFLFFLQLNALLWLQGYQYYPKDWRDYWRWTLLFILDIHNLIKDSGGANEASDSAAHTAFILILPLAALALYELLTRLVYADRVAGSITADRHRVSYLSFQSWSLVFAEQLYTPVVLLCCRVWTCGTTDTVVYINRNWGCWSGGHVFLIALVMLVSGSVAVAMPVVIYRRIKPILVFHDPDMHERYLQSRELEYIMGCNNLYEYTFFYTIGSFRRFWAWGRLFQLGQKAALVVLLIALNTYNAGDALLAQAVLILLVVSGPVLSNVFYRTYRCGSSNYLKAIFDAVLFFNCVMNVIEANPHGFSSSFIDPYTFSGMMLVVNCTGLGGAVLLCAYHLARERRAGRDHPGQCLDQSWPVRDSDLLALHQARPETIATLNLGKRLLEEALLTPEEFYPRQNLVEAICAMRTLLREAKARREGNKGRRSALGLGEDDRGASARSRRHMSPAEEALFLRTIRTGEEKSVALEWTVQDMVEDLALLYNTLAARASQDTQAQQQAQAAQAAGASGGHNEHARFERMQSAFAGFSESLHAKQLDRALMHPYKRDLLAKLLAVKSILTAGNPNFVYGERPPFTPGVLLPEVEAHALPPQQQQPQQQQHAQGQGQGHAPPSPMQHPLSPQQASRRLDRSSWNQSQMEHEVKIRIDAPSDGDYL